MDLTERLVATTAFSLGLVLADSSTKPACAGPDSPVVVVAELFSSEGCSSCPPAEEQLRTLDRTAPVPGVTLAVLEFHVDYWNDLGWTDAYSRPEYAERQREYARAFDDHQIFTPEIVLQGERVASSIDLRAERSWLAQKVKEPHADVAVTRHGASLEVRVSNVPGFAKSPEAWVAVTEVGIASSISAGENGGRRLLHGPVVRALLRAGSVSGSPFTARVPLVVRPGWREERLHFVGFVQERSSRRILGAGAT